MSTKNRIKFLLSILMTIISFYLMVTFLIIPDMKKVSDMQDNISRLEQNIKNLNVIEDNLKDIYNSLKNDYGFLKYFQKGFKKEDIENLLTVFGSNLETEEIYRKSRDSFLEKTFVINIDIDSPKDFYAFLKYIDENSLPIKIDYPIIFEKDKKKIDIRFTAVVYSFE